MIVEPQMQEEQCRFCSVHGTVDQLFTFQLFFKSHGSLYIESTYALWTWRKLIAMYVGDTLWTVLWGMGIGVVPLAHSDLIQPL